MSLFEARDNTIVLPLSTQSGEYLNPADIDDAEYAIFSSCYSKKLFEASLSGTTMTIVSIGADDALQVEIPSTVNICGQVPNELKVLVDGKWRGVTLSSGKITFIKTRF
jgi:hypothetical protein